MEKEKPKRFAAKFEAFAISVARAARYPLAFIIAFLIVLTGGITGPCFVFSFN